MSFCLLYCCNFLQCSQYDIRGRKIILRQKYKIISRRHQFSLCFLQFSSHFRNADNVMRQFQFSFSLLGFLDPFIPALYSDKILLPISFFQGASLRVLHQVSKRCETLAGVGNHAHTDLQKVARMVMVAWRTFPPALKTSKLIV